MRIFVDVDDTLILYDNDAEKNPYGVYHGTPWRPNQPLIDALLATEHPVTVWSGGGDEYAKEMSEKIGLSFPTLTKNGSNVLDHLQPGDIVIDDDDLGGLRTHNPFEWPEH